jgi:hypothetical protein
MDRRETAHKARYKAWLEELDSAQMTQHLEGLKAAQARYTRDQELFRQAVASMRTTIAKARTHSIILITITRNTATVAP